MKKKNIVLFNNKNLNMEIKGRQDPLKRCFENIINNALTYGTNVEIKV